MADSSKRSADEPPPQPQDGEPSKEADSPQPGPSEDLLQPRRGSQRVRWKERVSVSPSLSGSRSPSRNREEDDGNTLEDELLDALLSDNLPRFEELVSNKKCNKYHKYHNKDKFGVRHHGTCLEIACRLRNRGEFVRVLLEHVKPNVNRVVPEPIHYAAKKGNDDSLRVLLCDKRTRVCAQNSKGQTALHVACANASADRAQEYARCVKLLVPKMPVAELNKPDYFGFTAFHTLVRPAKRTRSVKSRLQSTEARENEEDTSEAGESAGRKSRETIESSRARIEDKSSEAGDEKKPKVPRKGGADAGEGEGEDDEATARERLAELLLRLAQGALDVDSVRARGRTAREDAELRFPRLRALLPPRREAAAARADPHAALADALRDGHIDLFRALLRQINADGNPALDPNHAFGYPLHTTCLELACARSDGAEFVRALLEAGADPNVPNKLSEKYPIHIACEKGHVRELEALFEYSTAIVELNCGDKFGNTPLHCTVDRISDDKRREVGRRKCLDILLQKPQLDVARTNNAGYSALLLAVEDGNKIVIRTFLSATNHFKDLDIKKFNFDANGRPLRILLGDTFPEIAVLLQRPGAPDTLKVRKQSTKDLFELLNPTREEEFVKQLKRSRPRELADMNDKKFTLLQRAAYYGMTKAARALLEAGVEPNHTFTGNLSPPGVIACLRCNAVIEVLLEHSDFDVNAVDAKGNTALHYAAKMEGNLETVILLLRHGANKLIRNKLGRSPFGKEQAQSLLDQCVKTNERNALDEDYELIFDYRLLAPSPHAECGVRRQFYAQIVCENGRDENDAVVVRSDNNPVCHKMVSEMDFLNMMSKDSELCSLLGHPVALSFLKLKWDRLKHLSFFNLGVYILFMIFLNTFIILATHRMFSVSKNPSIGNGFGGETNDIPMIAICAVTLFFWMLIVVREFTQLLLDAKNYRKSLENYLDWAVLILSLLSLLLPFTGADQESVRTINVATIMISCVELLLLLGRITRLAKYIEMLKVVIKNYLLPLISYTVILVAFGLSFHTLCYESSMLEQQKSANKSKSGNCSDEESVDFRSWSMSIVNALVMMIGELEFKSLPDRSPQSIILFVFFVLLVTVVLLNLLIGLAVSDTQKIEDAAQRLQLQSRVGVVLRSERNIVNMHNSDCCAAMRCLPVPQCLRLWLQRAFLFPRVGLDGREGRVKPNQTGEIVLGDGGVGERRWIDQQSLDHATQILSRRGAAASRALTLADVDARVQEVLKALALLESRCEHSYARAAAADAATREPRLSLMSVFSEEPPDDCDPETPSAVTREYRSYVNDPFA